jgi:hypothetical protein
MNLLESPVLALFARFRSCKNTVGYWMSANLRYSMPRGISFRNIELLIFDPFRKLRR